LVRANRFFGRLKWGRWLGFRRLFKLHFRFVVWSNVKIFGLDVDLDLRVYCLLICCSSAGVLLVE
jgi:hypothetical protein